MSAKVIKSESIDLIYELSHGSSKARKKLSDQFEQTTAIAAERLTDLFSKDAQPHKHRKPPKRTK